MRLRLALVGCAVALLMSLLLARIHPFGSATINPARSAQEVAIEHSSSPLQIRTILIAKCADCHSMQTRVPFYGHFAPVSWLLERDIREGRSRMNLSLWDTYSTDRQQTLRAEIVQQTRNRAMPPLQYRMLHWNTRITDADVLTFTQWAHGTPALATDALSLPSQPGDPVRGRNVFEKRCTGCHALEQNREGPRLQGVFGRSAGEVPGFPYSPALKKAHIIWNDSSLEQWLADPDTLVPGNNMEFHVAKPQERRDLIRFLQEGAAN